MSHVAAEAAISRTTLYKRFSKIEDVLQAVFVREFDRFERRLAKSLSALSNPAERLAAVVVATAENVPENAGIARLVEGRRSRAEARALAVGRSALSDRVETMISKPLDDLAALGRLHADLDRPEVIEWVRRLVLALAVAPQPGRRSLRARRCHVEKFLIPSICKPQSPSSHGKRRRSPAEGRT